MMMIIICPLFLSQTWGIAFQKGFVWHGLVTSSCLILSLQELVEYQFISHLILLSSRPSSNTLTLNTGNYGREKQTLAFVTIATKWRSFLTEGTQE